MLKPLVSVVTDWRSRSSVFLPYVILVFAAGYVLQAASPLRMTPDSVDYLRMAAAISDGTPLPHNHFPLGYPLMVAALERLGAASPAGLVLLNCAFLGLGLLATTVVLRELIPPGAGPSPGSIVALTLASWVIIRYAAVVHADIPYLGLSFAALAAQHRAAAMNGRLYVAWLALAVIMTACAVATRSVGVALVPALVWAAAMRAGDPRPRLRLRPRSARIAGVVVLAAVAATSGVVLVRTQYVKETIAEYRELGAADVLGRTARFKVTELGEIALNLPPGKLPDTLVLGVVPLTVGTVFLFFLIRGALLSRRHLAPGHVYALGYGAILFSYPSYDARLWGPLIPVVLAWVWVGIEGITPRRLLPGYALGFMLVGAVVLAFSTTITFSGVNFPRRYGKSTDLEGAYDRAYSQPTDAHVNDEALTLLYRYGRLGRRALSDAD
jgi:hypothetical protein